MAPKPELFWDTEEELSYWYAEVTSEEEPVGTDGSGNMIYGGGEPRISTSYTGSAYRMMSLEQAKEVRDELDRCIEMVEEYEA